MACFLLLLFFAHLCQSHVTVYFIALHEHHTKKTNTATVDATSLEPLEVTLRTLGSDPNALLLLHLDVRASRHFFAACQERVLRWVSAGGGGVRWMRSRRVEWGSADVSALLRAALRTATSLQRSWDTFINLSGSDVPLRLPVSSVVHAPSYHGLLRKPIAETVDAAVVSPALRAFCREKGKVVSLPKHARLACPFPVYKGQLWMSLPAHLVFATAGASRRADLALAELALYLGHLPDEKVMPTLVAALLTHANNTYHLPNSLTHHLTFRNRAKHPDTLTVATIEEIGRKRPANRRSFGRKVVGGTGVVEAVTNLLERECHE